MYGRSPRVWSGRVGSGRVADKVRMGPCSGILALSQQNRSRQEPGLPWVWGSHGDPMGMGMRWVHGDRNSVPTAALPRTRRTTKRTLPLTAYPMNRGRHATSLEINLTFGLFSWAPAGYLQRVQTEEP